MEGRRGREEERKRQRGERRERKWETGVHSREGSRRETEVLTKLE